MADKLHFELVSPERLIKSGEVDGVTVPGTEGDFTALPGHAPVLSTMRPGVLTIREDGVDARIFIRGGFAEVTADGLTILAEEAISMEDLDQARLGQEIKNAQDDVSDAKDDTIRSRAQEKLDHLRQLLSAV
jgi:F-type H+-transporting ATPase subunit epsilon